MYQYIFSQGATLANHIQAHIPDGLFCKVNAIFLLFTSRNERQSVCQFDNFDNLPKTNTRNEHKYHIMLPTFFSHHFGFDWLSFNLVMLFRLLLLKWYNYT